MTQSIILIVDDNEANRQTLESLLDNPELQLHYAADGPTALSMAAELQPDLVLLDIMMPGMNGFEVCTRLRADPQLAEVPVILITALDDRESRLRGIEAGADDFVTRPFDRSELRLRIRGILRLNRFRRLQDAGAQIREQAELIDLAPDAIFVRDLSQRITHWNPAASRLYGWSAAEALGQRADVLLATEDTIASQEGQPPTTEEWRGELTQSTRDEKEIIVDSRQKLLRDAAGKPKAILTINTDLTAKKQLEAQFLRAQRLESIGALASGIAHDLNNILSPSLMSIELLRARLPDETDSYLIDMLEESTERGGRLVRQILAFARGGDGEKSEVQLQHLVGEVHRMLSRVFPKNIEISVERSCEIWPVFGNPTQFDQVLMNLCVNARDAMPGGGKLVISLENQTLSDLDCAALRTMRPGPCVLLTISDTGSGMPAEVRERIFDPFFTTKDQGKGTGLGLSTVIGVVKAHSGWISVESEVGVGTRFKIYFPAATRSSETIALTDPKRDLLRGRGERLLIVDDEKSILKATADTLAHIGYQPLCASDGLRALELFAEHTDSIRMVITDALMPNLDGTLLARAIHRLSPNLPIIMMTGVLEATPPNDGSVIEMLRKPLKVEQLLCSIRRGLDLQDEE
jgi:two-component system, cell cycle sensor histidine kinase and response regulator CckA